MTIINDLCLPERRAAAFLLIVLYITVHLAISVHFSVRVIQT